MDFENVITLIKTVSDSHITSFEYEENETCIKMKTDKREKIVTTMPMPGQTEQMMVNTLQMPAPAVTPVESGSNDASDLTGKVVKSPLVGTFYSAAAPDDAPFVQVGDSVKKGQVLGIVEAMKLMNEIESEYDGVVKEVLVSDASVVEYDQPMFVIA